MTAPTAPTTVADYIKQGYILASHTRVNELGLEIGEAIIVNNFAIERTNENGAGKTVTDRLGLPLVAGTSCKTVSSDPYYNGGAVFRGINAAGDVVVQVGRAEHAVPYTFIKRDGESPEKQRANLKLNDRYTGTVLGDASHIAVGCQRFKTDKLRELLTLADKAAAEVAAAKAASAAKASTPVSLTPTATYVAPAPKAAKKVATKKVATKTTASAAVKAPAKKVATKRVR